MVENVIIIGSGPAGLSAALYTAREGFGPLVIAGTDEGGQLILTTVVENYPAFPDGIDGTELINRMRKQAEKQGARFEHGYVKDVDFSSRPFKVFTETGVHEAKCVIVCSGASSVWLGLESETRFRGRGVSSCATCDAPLFKNKDVVVVGGGDTAMEDSLFLTKFANSITILHRRDEFRASKVMQKRVLSNSKIKVVWNTIVEDIKGSTKVESVSTKNVKTGERLEIKTDGVFVAIGHKPNTDFLKGKLDLDGNGYVVVSNSIETKIKGVYVGGDVADPVYKQAITAAGTGTMCALKVREFLQNDEER